MLGRRALSLLRTVLGGLAVAMVTSTGAQDSNEERSPEAVVVVQEVGRQLEEKLISEREPTAGETARLADALRAYRKASTNDILAPLSDYLRGNPDSPWYLSLATNYGLVAYHYGFFSLALDAWSEVWTRGKLTDDARTKPIVDRALGELTRMMARLGRVDDVERLLTESKGRTVVGPATEWLTGAREALWVMRNEPGRAFLCGPRAIRSVFEVERKGESAPTSLRTFEATRRGVSIGAVERLARRSGLDWRAVKRTSSAKVPVPSIVHWRLNHYAAVISEDGNRYQVRDSTFGDDLWIPKSALEH